MGSVSSDIDAMMGLWSVEIGILDVLKRLNLSNHGVIILSNSWESMKLITRTKINVPS